jgi:hypothetical protein
MVHSAEVGSIPVPDMSALIARLEAAEAGSRELNGDVASATVGFMAWDGEPITQSLDAALALAERVLPDHMRGPISLCIAGSAEAYIDHVDPCGDSVKAFGKTPALALCICILWAIQHGYEAAGVVSPNLKAKAQGEGG